MAPTAAPAMPLLAPIRTPLVGSTPQPVRTPPAPSTRGNKSAPHQHHQQRPAEASGSAGAALSAAAHARLERDRRTHDALTDDLVGLAASLKANTLAMEGKVRERGSLLDSAEAALERSMQATKQSAAKATEIHNRSAGNEGILKFLMRERHCFFGGGVKHEGV
jgi:hypothetical protein